MQSDSDELTSMQTRWASQLNPLLANPLTAGRLIRNVELSTGANTINHGLGRKLQGWVLTRLRAAAQIYDMQDSSIIPNLTLTLVSDANVAVDLWVF